MKTLKDIAVEFRLGGEMDCQQRQHRLNAELAEMPGFAEWVKKSLPCLAGRMIGKNGFNHGLAIAGQSYGSCTWQGDTLYTAILNADCSVTIFADDDEAGTFPLEDGELIHLVSKKIGSSWHPHWKQWDVYHWGWDITPTPELVGEWSAEKSAAISSDNTRRAQQHAAAVKAVTEIISWAWERNLFCEETVRQAQEEAKRLAPDGDFGSWHFVEPNTPQDRSAFGGNFSKLGRCQMSSMGTGRDVQILQVAIGRVKTATEALPVLA